MAHKLLISRYKPIEIFTVPPLVNERKINLEYKIAERIKEANKKRRTVHQV
ncbi:MAG: hypothetical protein Edafosvirus11_14 [Edafosvirus sp.]|uniref:Uncharacterized protein n=1 Tax=Edafosvirus sp. TaxID=2487765 RepID=A0A3G4ZYA0_9VIRU|nr:MAG: hypothetical protein Edafosvirus11_14 [Edafosvirus sp.]